MKNIFYKIKGYENYNKEYEKALAKEKALSIEDEINILYVALTRAKNNMIIFKKIKSSVFDILNMSPCKIGNIIQSINISKNYDKIEKIVYTPLNLGTQDKQLANEKELDENHLHAKYFGITTHYCLEMMDEFTIDCLEYTLKLAISRYSNYLNEVDFIDIKNRISMLIKNNDFISIINDSEFITEQSLIYKEEIKIIDLLLFKNDTYYIIDYKTTKDRLPEHIAQVSFYKKAIKDIFSTNEVKAYLVYLHSNESFIQEI